MTQAKLAASPADGHGLTDRITGPLYTAYSKGEPIEYIPALVLLKVTGNGGHDTANGRVNHIKLEAVRLEPILEPGDRDEMLWKLQNLYEVRTSNGTQTSLPIGLEGEERRRYQIEKIDAWADANSLTEGDVSEKWRAAFGIGDDPDANYFGIPGDWRTASYSYLLQFSIEQGIEKAEPDTELDDDDLGTADDDPAAGE